MELKNLFSPKSIAVIGANESDGFGGAVCKNLLNDFKYQNNLYFVSKNHNEVYGKKCYKTILDIENDIDLLIIATNKNTVLDVLNDAKQKKVKAAVVYASGFSETLKEEDVLREEELKKISIETGILILGPNCAGFVNYIDHINAFAFLSDKRERKGDIGIVSQSGMISLSFIDNQWPKMSYNISCGNSNIIKFTDYIDFLIDDENTNVIALHIDVIKNIFLFEECLKKAKNKNKPIVLYKSGSSEKSKLISKNHTGGEDLINNDDFNKLIKKYDCIRADDTEELIYISTFLSVSKCRIKGNGIASLNLSGGEAGVACDVGSMYDISFPDFKSDLVDYLYENLPSYAKVSNPLDMTATLSYDTEKLTIVLEKVLMQDNIDIILIGYTILNHIDDNCIYYILDAIKNIKQKSKNNNKPIILLSFMSNTREQKCIEKLMKLGVVAMPSPKYTFSIIEKLII